MSLNILCIGDIVGRPGRHILKKALKTITQTHDVDFVIANAENAAGGFGITSKIYKELSQLGIQAFTSGNHIFNKKNCLLEFDQYETLIRPLNFPPGNPGVGYRIFKIKNQSIALVNLIGRVFIGCYDCPFQIIEKNLPQIQSEADIILIDFHAEATSEKQAMGRFLDGKATALWGTHTHVQTADECILPNGSAYISDIGMCGAYHSILGMTIEPVLDRFLTQMNHRINPAQTTEYLFNGIILTIESKTRRVTRISRISEIFTS